jgi:transposase
MSESLEEFYTNLLAITDPWEVTAIKRDSISREVVAKVSLKVDSPLLCPICGVAAKLHDHRSRRWRHLDSCNHKTIVEADIPRVECAEHGVKQVAVTWAIKGSRFTAEFESTVLLWLKGDSIATVAENFRLTWDEVDGIQSRAVERGIDRRQKTTPKNIGIDETSFQKHHEYVTVILDKDTDSIIDILDDRKAITLKTWFETQGKSDFSQLKSITMDMWDPFINAVKKNFEDAQKLIAFDRFHVSQHFGRALNKVRSEEHRGFLTANEQSPLIRSKYQWLTNSQRTDNRATRRKEFLQLSRLNLKTARAWQIKEAASTLWNYSYMSVAETNWQQLLGWISRCRLKPVIAVGKMVRRYFWGILNAIRLKANNSMLEAKNSCIQRIKKIACGFRNRKRFKNAILFHLGGLDLQPFPTR